MNAGRRAIIMKRYKALNNSNWWEQADFSTYCAQTYSQQKERIDMDKYKKRHER